ncbi:unnamed protein product [Symbiodinium necroappetens]|uniref:Uncharacterized protein n=1 Tax=Symbiodinium necroappetens TaxID=1628268 RepID=A0A812ZJ04_9DINO|nr:unnamed protein product [Symbiodinium necroappetens]
MKIKLFDLALRTVAIWALACCGCCPLATRPLVSRLLAGLPVMMALLWIMLALSACDSFAELCSGDGMPSQGDHCFSGSSAAVRLRMAGQAKGTVDTKFVQALDQAECHGLTFDVKGAGIAGNVGQCPLLAKYEAKYCSNQDKLVVNFTEANQSGVLNFTGAVLGIDMKRGNCSVLFRNVTRADANETGKAEPASSKSGPSLRGQKAKTASGRVCCDDFSMPKPSPSFADAMQAKERCKQAYGLCSHQYIHYHIDNTHALHCFGRHCWGD